ncbi:50S ribosome-binding GTPase [Kineosporia sp. J2-2]|uniref:50S ribosome-binding GTPase n=1 Tax=Kineosporia corallincola TaxID=2835133 RepID=A0ABS5TE59_9ACTN|nr:GTPase [Kineosporia corallincola]MBT0769352.1 50S ribosome-binding GTPase [Kineosporia corallincola]
MTDVMGRVAALSAALDCGAPWLPPEAVQKTRDRMEHVGHRLDLGTDRTVVALVGATGGGKSSLFNAIARMDIAAVGARRPFTTSPMACVWGELGSEKLLDWLQVPADRRMTRESVLDADDQAVLHGLVLLDLPDHDSTEAVHRVEVDRLVRMVDLMIWVVDPQKYADNVLHAGYLQKLTSHDGVMLVVLNQVDKLSPEETETCVTDLRRLLDGDGLARVGIVPVSATRGDGVDELRALLADVVQDRFAVIERIESDLDIAAEEIAAGLAASEPGAGQPVSQDKLVNDLAAASGTSALLDALAAEYRRRGRQKLAWAPAAWVARIAARRKSTGPAEARLQAETASLKALASPSQRPAVRLAVEAMLADNAGPLPERWAKEARTLVARAGDPAVSPEDVLLPSGVQGSSGGAAGAALAGRGRHTPAYGLPKITPTTGVPSDPDGLARVLDSRLAAVDLRFSTPLWWHLTQFVQQLLALGSVIGVLWLAVLVLGRLAGQEPSGALGSLPLAVSLVVGGLVAGLLLRLLSRWWLTAGARNRRAELDGRLREAVAEVAAERVVAPIRSVLARHRETRQVLLGERSPTSGAAEPTPGADETEQSDPEPVAALSR